MPTCVYRPCLLLFLFFLPQVHAQYTAVHDVFLTYAPEGAAESISDSVLLKRNIVYCEYSGKKLTLDFYSPRDTTPHPLIIYLHGGGWRTGSKDAVPVTNVNELVSRGYSVASINYRLLPQATHPAPIEDVQCALRFFEQHAATYGLNTAQIGLWGESAGAHTAAFVALQSNEVQAVAALYPPTDLTQRADFTYEVEALIGREFPDTHKASLPQYVDAADPPLLLVHAYDDETVNYRQAQLLEDALRAHNVPYQFVHVIHGYHGMSSTALAQLLGDFFDAHLRGVVPIERSAVRASAPSGELPGDTAATVLTVETPVAANCTYTPEYTSDAVPFNGDLFHHAAYIDHLERGNEYNFAVSCADAHGAQFAPYVIHFTVEPDVAPPSRPRNLTAKAVSASQIELAWEPASDDVGVVRYVIYYSDALADQHSYRLSTKNTWFVDTDLAAQQSYSYLVYAVDAANNFGWPSFANATTLAVGAAQAPVDLSVELPFVPLERAGLLVQRALWASHDSNVLVQVPIRYYVRY